MTDRLTQPIPFSNEMLDILGATSPSTEDEYLAFANTFLPPRTPPTSAITDVEGTRKGRVSDAKLVGDAYRLLSATTRKTNRRGTTAMTENNSTEPQDPFVDGDGYVHDAETTAHTVGNQPASTGHLGESSADDVRSLLAESLGGFSPMPELPQWRLVEIAEGAGPTIWNEARRALEDSITSGQFEAQVRREHASAGRADSTADVALRLDTERARKLEPWRIDNPAHLGQAWLSLDNNNRDDRIFAYLTSTGQQRLLMVTDSRPDAEYATWEPTGFRDVSDAVSELRAIRSAVRTARDLSITDDFSGAEDRSVLVGDDFS